MIAKSCKKLKELDLGHCHGITDEGICALKSLKNLQSLNMSHTNLTDEGVIGLFFENFNFKVSLKELRLDHCPNITDDAVEVVLETCQDKLNIFIVHSCPKTTDRSVQALEQFWTNQQSVKQITWTIF